MRNHGVARVQSSAALDPRRSIDLHFVDPVTQAPATTDYVSALFFDSEVGSFAGELTAFDAAGNLLATSQPTTPIGYASTAIVSAPGIAWVRFSDIDDGLNIDNVSFKSPSIPEPATYASCWAVRQRCSSCGAAGAARPDRSEPDENALIWHHRWGELKGHVATLDNGAN